MRRTILVAAIFAAFFLPAKAQDKKDNQSAPEKQDYKVKLIVTDTKVAQSEKNVTQQVSVISTIEMELQTAPNRNISELLKYQPGYFVDVLSRNDANWGSYGGLGPKYSTYLLDGLPVDSFVDTMSLDPWAFSRIEAYRGPASVLYANYMNMDFAGNEAPLSGLTNLILKDRIEQAGTRLFLGGGSYGTFHAKAFHENRKGDFNYFFGADYERSDYTNYGTADSWLHILDDPQYQKMKLYGKMTYLFHREDHKISFFAHHTSHNGDAGRPNRDYNHGYDTLNALYSNQVNARLNVQLKTGFRNYDRRWGEDNYPADLGLRSHDGVQQKIVPSDVTFNIKHSGESLFTVGADSQYVTYHTYSEVEGVRNSGNDATAFAAGFFAQEKLITGNWVLRFGGRINSTHHSYALIGGSTPGLADKSWNNFLWSTGVRYNASKRVAVYANLGSSFIAPSAKSVGGTLNPSERGQPGHNGQLPNPDLKPESGIGFDTGSEMQISDRVTLGVRFFVNWVKDAIVDNVVSQNPSQTISINAGNARSLGIEVPFRYRVSDRLDWFVNLTGMGTRVKNPLDPDQDGANLPFVPDLVVNAGMGIKLPHQFTFSPYLQAVGTYYDSTSKSGRRSFGSYQELNLRIMKRLFESDGFATNLTLDLNNLTNNKYELPWQFRNPGFNFFCGLEFGF